MKNKKFKYTLMMAMPFMLMGFSACQEYEHPVVIERNESLGSGEPFVVFRDIETGSVKFYFLYNEPKLLNLVHTGDTADIICREGLFFNQERNYQKRKVINRGKANMDISVKTLLDRDPTNKTLQSMFATDENSKIRM